MDCSRARTRDPLEWLAMSPEFSAPLVHRARESLLGWAPDLSEAIKWNMLCFSGRKLVCGLSACQRHLGLTFFRGSELSDPTGLLAGQGTVIRTVRVTDWDAVDHRALRRLVEAAVVLDGSARLLPPPRGRREPLPMPEVLAEALARDPGAAAGFARLSPSCQRVYLVWVGSAKRDETRDRRVAETLRAVRQGRRWEDRRRA